MSGVTLQAEKRIRSLPRSLLIEELSKIDEDTGAHHDLSLNNSALQEQVLRYVARHQEELSAERPNFD